VTDCPGCTFCDELDERRFYARLGAGQWACRQCFVDGHLSSTPEPATFEQEQAIRMRMMAHNGQHRHLVNKGLT